MVEARGVDWLLDTDSSVRWQVLRDIVHAPAAEVATARKHAAESGWIAQLLQSQRPDGNWGVGVYDGDGWDSTTDALWILRELGADPTHERIEHAIDLVSTNVCWEERHGGRPFFEGETEPCVNGRVAALGAYFGRPSGELIDRLLSEQLADGGWNCDAPDSTRSSFHSTICVLEGLLEFERATGSVGAINEARRRGDEYLLERGLLRSMSTGLLLDTNWLNPHVPAYWCYDVLRGLDYLRATGAAPDPRVNDALAALQKSGGADGTWAAEQHAGRPVIDLQPGGDASRIATIRALRVLEWGGLPS